MAASDIEDAGAPASPDADFGDHDESEDIMAEPHSALLDKASTSVNKTESNASGSSDHQTPTNGNAVASKPNPKDPSRPRRKKARRACFACQRAHLTCGDERPCTRCVKRNLQDQCHDGVRKKAKYLSDTPSELLNPPVMGGYHPYINGTKNTSSTSEASGVPMTGSTSGHYPQPQTPTIDVYGQASTQAQMPPPLPTAPSFGSQQSPMSPQFAQHPNQQNMQTTMAQNNQGMTQFNGLPFDPSDPALFNFDIASLNFGNQYGALEFGMLNHMSSNANGAEAQSDMMNQMNMQNYNQNYTPDPSLTFSQDAFINADWASNNPRAQSSSGLLQTPNNTPVITGIDRHDSTSHFPKAYAIGAGPSSMASGSPAASTGVPDPNIDQPHSPALFLNTSQAPSSPIMQRHQPTTSKHQHHAVQPVSASNEFYSQPQQGQQQSVTSAAANTRKRSAGADFIYDTVDKPYPYTSGFHRLFNYIARTFSSEKRLRVAKAVSAIRPSLITFSQSLTERDLVFMEQSVQRKLYEFRDFLQMTGTPTIMARRDGAIVSASKEFSILTGWSKAVLLGREPNMNVNSGGASGASTTAPGSAARTRQVSVERDTAPQQGKGSPSALAPVLLAEILDQDTVVEFYEDYAKLAFQSTGGSCMRRGRLLKYRTHAELGRADEHEEQERSSKKRKRSQSVKDEGAGAGAYIKNEEGIARLGEKEGSVDVMFVWTVRRDVFEVPTLIVMNFLPIL